jgi:hypothetical protein
MSEMVNKLILNVRKIIGGPNKRAWMVKLYAWDI